MFITQPKEYQLEYNQTMNALLAKRFRWLCICWLGFIIIRYLFLVLISLIDIKSPETGLSELLHLLRNPLLVIGELGKIAVIIWGLWQVRSNRLTINQILRRAYWMIIVSGLCTLGSGAGLRTSVEVIGANAGMSQVILDISWGHLLVCIFLPWTARQAVTPLFVLYPIWIVMTLILDGINSTIILGIAGCLISCLALALCRFKSSIIRKKIENQYLQRFYQKQKRELVDARKIHEAYFPNPILTGPIRFAYSYEPMRQVGGDFLYTHIDAAGSLHIALIDVTGHGLPAALTVNRIDGELQRVYGENPQTSPDQTMTLLNKYIHLTMAKHSIYATAVCLSITTEGKLTWSSAGHPPCFLKRADSSMQQLNSTAFMLGVCPADAFDSGVQYDQINPGDSLIIYTDGACEACDIRGREFGIQGIAQTLKSWSNQIPPEDIARYLPDVIREYRHGPALDDILVSTISLSSADVTAA